MNVCNTLIIPYVIMRTTSQLCRHRYNGLSTSFLNQIMLTPNVLAEYCHPHKHILVIACTYHLCMYVCIHAHIFTCLKSHDTKQSPPHLAQKSVLWLYVYSLKHNISRIIFYDEESSLEYFFHICPTTHSSENVKKISVLPHPSMYYCFHYISKETKYMMMQAKNEL